MKRAALLILSFVVILRGYSQVNTPEMLIPNYALQKINNFKREQKFIKEVGEDYQGLSVPELRPKFEAIFSDVADDFKVVVQDHPTEKKFQDIMKNALLKFDPYKEQIDTEDREKVCSYFQELMYCVGLKSAGGILNIWLYGFDPNERK